MKVNKILKKSHITSCHNIQSCDVDTEAFQLKEQMVR